METISNRIVNEVKGEPGGARHHQQAPGTIEWE